MLQRQPKEKAAGNRLWIKGLALIVPLFMGRNSGLLPRYMTESSTEFGNTIVNPALASGVRKGTSGTPADVPNVGL